MSRGISAQETLEGITDEWSTAAEIHQRIGAAFKRSLRATGIACETLAKQGEVEVDIRQSTGFQGVTYRLYRRVQQ